MKIKKEKKALLEAVDLMEAEEGTAQTQLNNAGEAPTELNDASVAQVAADIQQGAKATGQEITAKDAVKEAKKVFDAADLIRNPYGTAQIGKVEEVLQQSLDDMLDQQYLNSWAKQGTGDDVIRNDFPNVLIYGSAGFAKTAIVKKFCRDHKLNLFPLDAKTLDLATVSGIPYPKQDPKTGEWTQLPISSKIWQSLELPNTVIFLDELNRANGRIRGTLLTLINEHILPIAVEDKETGAVKIEKYFPNILFTVSAVNPASDLYRDANELDVAELSRNSAFVKQEASVKEYWNYLKGLYDAIAKIGEVDPNNPELQRIIGKYAGQARIAETVLLDKNFEFDTDEDNRDNARAGRKNGTMFNSLNYRTFFLTLKKCDGTLKGYLRTLENSGFSQTKINIIKNALANYQDKNTVGNKVFNQPSTNSQKARAAKAAASTAQALDQFAASLAD